MAKHTWSININGLGASDDPDEAYDLAADRLVNAAAKVKARQLTSDPGVSVRSFDPGGGPCTPQKIAIEIIIDQDILPEVEDDD